jgi:hypothetical protein
MNRNARKLLQRLAHDFNVRHHGLLSKLGEYQKSVIELLDLSESGMAKGISENPPLEDLIFDLRSSGHLKTTDSMYVSLTELGLKEGSRGSCGRLWDFINRSPGIAILVSFCSLILAVLALLKGS